MQSKFWAEGSESSSESYSDYSSQDDTDRRLQATVPPPRWATIDSSSDEGTRRVVKSVRAKIRDSINASIKILTQHSRIGDYVETLEDYDNLLKIVDKMCQDEPFPKIALSAILDLQNLVEKILKDKESVKKFSRAKSTALNTLKSRLRKFNDSHQEEIEKFRENPEITDSEASSSESDSDSNSESDAEGERGEPSEISSDWSYSGSEKSADEDKHKSALAKWGIKKKDDAASSKKKDKGGRRKEDKVEAKVQHKQSFQSGSDINAALEGSDLSESALRSFLKIIVGKRGRRGVDKVENTNLLQKLAECAKKISFPCYLEVLCHVIHSQFDSSADAFSSMNCNVWMDTFKNVEIVIHILNTEKDEELNKGEMFEENETFVTTSVVASANKDSNPWVTLLTSFVQKLNDELCKSLLYTDLHSDMYKVMLSYSINMLYLLFCALSYTLRKGSMVHSSTLALAILEHIHYKADGLDVKLWDMVRQKFNSPFEIALDVETRTVQAGIPENLNEYFPQEPTLTGVVDSLVSFIFKEGSGVQKTRACLFWSYNKALHGDYFKAKELSCAINVQDMALQVDVATQIYFNRNLAQLGLCAFSHGHINDAHSYLVDLCSQNRLKELLAQGLSAKSDKTPEQERTEKRRLFPYHMHLNLEVIECVNNICAMLIEIPNMTRPFMGNKEIVSRQFRRMLEIYEKQNYVGPAENSKETIIVASKALQRGDWKECFGFIESLNIWGKFPNEERVKALLLLRIKKEALRTFIFRYAYSE